MRIREPAPHLTPSALLHSPKLKTPKNPKFTLNATSQTVAKGVCWKYPSWVEPSDAFIKKGGFAILQEGFANPQLDRCCSQLWKARKRKENVHRKRFSGDFSAFSPHLSTHNVVLGSGRLLSPPLADPREEPVAKPTAPRLRHAAKIQGFIHPGELFVLGKAPSPAAGYNPTLSDAFWFRKCDPAPKLTPGSSRYSLERIYRIAAPRARHLRGIQE